MDELIFRSSQKLDTLQIQLGLLSSRSKDYFQLYCEQSKSLIIQTWNNSKTIEIRENLKELWLYIVDHVGAVRYKVQFYTDPRRIYMNILSIFGRHWTKRDIFIGLTGFFVGGIVGIAIGLTIRKKHLATRYMQAIQCRYYLGTESVIVAEDAIAPFICGDNDVLVDVKAASVQVLDNLICNGYGKNLRKILRNLYENSTDLPITLGRDCTGIITDIGKNVKRFEIGDQVWLTVPFWAQGTLSQTVLVPEVRVGKKPTNIGFEGASSIPYAGCLALNALKNSQVTFENAQDKRVLIHCGCTPVGCVLIQVLKHWGADVTSTCIKRSMPVIKALGSDDIIILPEYDETDSEIEYKTLIKEIEMREKFDVIILTAECCIPINELKNFTKFDSICTTMPFKLNSDSFGIFRRTILNIFIRLQWSLEILTGISSNYYDEAHMCHSSLDQLASLVKNGHLLTVVDKVYQPQDIDVALSHIESPQAIGSTIITFR